MRGLFLDFDGVAHPVSAIADWRDLNVHAADLPHLIEMRDLFRWLPLLERLLDDHPDVLLVVHSGWRGVADNSEMKRILGPSLAQRFIGVTSTELERYVGIQEFAQRSGMSQYLIIDDATHEFPQECPGLVATDPERGLNDPEILNYLNSWLESSNPTQTSAMPATMTG